MTERGLEEAQGTSHEGDHLDWHGHATGEGHH